MRTLNDVMITDITELIENLSKLKNFIKNKVEDDDLRFFGKVNTIHTDIILLKNKLKTK